MAPCGHCKEECKSRTSVACGFCETWFHAKCVDGMTAEFLDCVDKMNRMHGAGSAFLCFICRKIVGKVNHSLKEMEASLAAADERIKNVELELKVMKEEATKTDKKADQAKEKFVQIEKEVESGMEKAKKEAKEEMKAEMEERKEKASNVVVYGAKESASNDTTERKRHDKKILSDLLEEIEVEAEEGIEVLFRAGKKGEPDKPRPMIIRVQNDETREKIFSNARRLARKEEWKKVFVAQDLTWQQREEARKKEKELKEEAEKRTEAAKNEGKKGRYVVIGQRGKNRRMVWREERPETETE